MNLASLLEGPANVTHLGQLFHFRGGLTLTPIADLFPIETDTAGIVDHRALDNSFVLSGTPIGVWTAAQLAALYRTAQLAPGSLVTPRYDVDAIDTATDIVSILGAPTIRVGCPMRMVVGAGGVLPAVSAGSLADVIYRSATGKFYTTQAAAIADAGGTLINFTDDGTGDVYLIEQEPLVIDALSANRRITLHNAAVIAPPPAILSAVATALGQVAFGCFRKEGAAWADENSLYSVTKVALADTPPEADDIPTQEYSCAFGAAPWATFKPRGPITLTPTLQTDPITTDGRGLLGMKVASRGISATLAPAGFSEAQMLDLLAMQGGTVARGKSRVRGDLVITGTGVHCTVYNGAPRQLPQTFQTTGPRAGELEIVGHATPGEAPFRFDVAAP